MSTHENGNILFFHGQDCPLSNWHPRGFWLKAIWFAHVEQFMMFCKARLFNDFVTAQQIMDTQDQMTCKRLGRQVQGFDDAIWAQHRERYVLVGAVAKFQQNPGAKAYLLSTVGRELVEASRNDTIWGIGLGMDDARIYDRTKWRGQNLLGPVLMQARNIIQSD